ncbi:TPA: DUF551 domain-containing protein [Enterobacter cloacae]|uniref:DUF551 domain-containing protein n=1 Tax=Enterobacter cloacae complex TaxID=354276 RepID=UPI000BD25E45|nr:MULTISPECIES: DUF551 domain-containing protein [Enterobacter cloacae complex]MCR2776586.1 DUF551 domain-containing protein [Enterobacter kobei]PCM68964.1 hypothetical protein CP904_26540 [Enterobacter cloacae]HBN5546541.1 DUF551 domain-containing protein [Enterobacter cloacae]
MMTDKDLTDDVLDEIIAGAKTSMEQYLALSLKAERAANRQQNAQQNIPENIPTLRDGLAVIRSLGEIDAAKIQAERDSLNSPLIPDGWVACSERMPEEGSKVIVFRPRASESNDPPVKTATYKGGREYYHGFDCYCEPTHWMPLPAAPQQGA